MIRARKKRQQTGEQPHPGSEFEGVSDLIRAVQDFHVEAEALDREAESAARRDGLNLTRLASLNDAIAAIERALLLGEGLPGRPWFRHAIYAPGLTTGYAAWPLPAVRQALEEDKPELLAPAVAKTADRIRQAAAALKAAADRARSASEAG